MPEEEAAVQEVAEDTVSPEMLERLRAANDHLHSAKSEWESANETAKDLKKDMEAAQIRLNRVADDIAHGKVEMPLFKPPDTGADGEPAMWRNMPLVELQPPEISVKTLKALDEHEPPIVNLGELSDWQNEKGDFWAKDIHGLGPAGRAEIEEACQGFWLRHKDDAAAEASDQPSEPDEQREETSEPLAE